ncbi:MULTISPECIES: restriction endonuclease subunit S [Methylomicrobium]|uniref:Restriction endonuclease S subunit n=1 Tax=Methylomicrobium album BG8 TaxID=686340 RepID=H8GQ93_METAL|nr:MULTISPECIES: restriction endonuclease subunit S [Methylomicrobium]EIC28552.1 restriction endonuclease S subunit [Methylomicrobium album BG8]
MIEQLAEMPTYEAYKDSGVEWLGEIPAYWNIKRLKYEANVVLGKMLCTENKGNYQLKPYLKSKNIQWLNVDISSTDEMWFSPSEIELYRLMHGDLILSEGGEVGKTCIWNNELDECYIQNSAHKITFSKENNSRFFLYLFFITGKIGLFDSIVNRVSIAHLTKEKLTNIHFLFPPLFEQTAIAAFLDCKTAQIDQAVAIKEQQIALLKERKQILIQNAVTRGLDPNVPMRNSGVEWIGKIPEHWELITLKRIVYFIQTGPFGAELHAHDYVENGTPLINPKHMKEGNIIPDATCSVDNNTLLRLKKYQLANGDLIMARRGELGRCAVVSTKEHGWLCGTGSIVIRLKHDYFNVKYFFRIISGRGVAEVLGLDSVGSTMDNLNTAIVGNLVLPMPNMEEQTAIVTHIETQSAKIDQAIAIQQQQIDKLKEYKATLINSAVTGKVRISDAVQLEGVR